MAESKYKVIAILDNKRIAINYGRNNKASKRDVVRVIEVGPEISYEGENYGTMDTIKANLSIDTIYDKFSICTNRSIENDMTRSIIGSFSPKIRIYEDLNVNKEQISNLEKPDLSPISLGDAVEIIKFN
uniref:hypothetical protein n=1 Tax=Anaerococcus mediterraneensis TaxID=1870984 RepID=UPI000931ABB7|nr:hypothetical protein [Anaerococcus mediterraneensis]